MRPGPWEAHLSQTALSPTLDLRLLLSALAAFNKGDFAVRLPEEGSGLGSRIAETFNEVVERSERMAAELERLGRAVVEQGRANQRISLGDVSGSWATSVSCVNALVTDLVHPTIET